MLASPRPSGHWWSPSSRFCGARRARFYQTARRLKTMAGDLRVHRRPELTRPVLVAAFRGWNDGAQAASLAAGYLAKTWEAERFADVDPEDFFDFQAARPHVSLEDGITRRIDWPETAFYHARPDGLDRDVVLLLGIEPNLRWRTFTELEEAARSYEEQVSEAVASDEDTASYVEELERRVDELEEQTDLPSGDALAAELTRFLREREEDDDGGDAAREQ